MNARNLAAPVGVAISASAGTSWDESPNGALQPETTAISVASHQVSVLNKGELYDRYRSNPPLSVITAEAPDVDLSWFKQLKMKELIPVKVLEQVQPLQVWPGRGLIALTAHSYRYCDNDSRFTPQDLRSQHANHPGSHRPDRRGARAGTAAHDHA